MNAQKRLLVLVASLLVITQSLAGCASTPIFHESNVPISRIIVKTDSKDNCDSPQSVNATLRAVDTRSQETAWSVDGKAGVGGKIPLGFLIPSLDIEASIAEHYGGKETRTWENSYQEDSVVPANTKAVLAVFYQEMTRTGVIEIYGKRIEYEYPAEITRLGWDNAAQPCHLPPLYTYTCYAPDDNYTLPPRFETLAGTWRLQSPKHGEIVQIEVQIEGGNVSIHVYTDGASGVADWGTQPQCIWSDPMQVVFDHLGFKTTTLTLHSSRGGELSVTAEDYYTDPPVYIPVQTTDYLFVR